MLRLTAALMILTAACSQNPDTSNREFEATWVDAWQAAPSGVMPHRCAGTRALAAFPNNEAKSQTLRFSVRPSVAGNAIRVGLSNRLSDAPLEIRHVTVGEHSSGAAVVRGTLRDVLFGRARAVTVAPGDDRLSDTVAVDVNPGRLLTVSIAIAAGGPLTWHADGPALAYAASHGSGDLTAAATTSKFATPLKAVAVLNAVQVRTPRPTTAIVALGDSLTDAATISPKDHWLDILGERLKRRGVARSLLNAGITCNRVLQSTPGGGPAAPARFAADVLTRTGVSHVILFEGTNDLAGGATAEALIAAITDLAVRARTAGLRVVGATLFPNNGAPPNQQAQRRALNRWIRTTEALDGYVDFDRVIRDPANPNRINPAYNGDGVHVNSRGRRAMGGAINLSLFS